MKKYIVLIGLQYFVENTTVNITLNFDKKPILPA
jgi:hypothetical protein